MGPKTQRLKPPSQLCIRLGCEYAARPWRMFCAAHLHRPALTRELELFNYIREQRRKDKLP